MRSPPPDSTPPTARRDPRLTVVVPTYNERESIRRTLSAVLEHAPAATELVVVDDDSPDRTWAIVARAHRGDPRVRVERRTDERGLGSAIVHGITRARGEYCLVMDADLQHPPAAIPRLVALGDEGADLVVGTRYGDGGHVDGWPAWRRLVSRGAVAVAKLALPRARSVSDPVSGFFLVRTDVVDGLDLEPTGWKTLLDVLLHTDGPVAEVGFRFAPRERGRSKLTVRACLGFLGHVCALALTGRRRREGHELSLPASEYGE